MRNMEDAKKYLISFVVSYLFIIFINVNKHTVEYTNVWIQKNITAAMPTCPTSFRGLGWINTGQTL